MAYSNEIGTRTTTALKVVDHAFRRCRLPAQAITSEMQEYALQSLFTFLSSLANPKPPSWCIQKIILPMYENQPVVPLPAGTVEILNLNYRSIQALSGSVSTTSTSYTVDLGSAAVINVVGIKWTAAAVNFVVETSDNNSTWSKVADVTTTKTAGEIDWVDISGATAARYIRVVGSAALNYEWIEFGNTPQEIPLGLLNRDNYVNQSNKQFPSRPNSFWFQRNLANPVLNLWPAPFLAAEKAQLVVWRHREIMSTKNLRQEIEVPNRWLEAIIANLASLVGLETPQVPIEIVAKLEMNAAMRLQEARDGDNDGSSTFINPGIGAYTK